MITQGLSQSTAGRGGVIVTGCSSGIGREIAIGLALCGFTVFAAVRKKADAEKLSDFHIDNLVPVCPLDLANPAHISKAAFFVERELKKRHMDGLYAIINNAGGGTPAPIEMMEVDEFRTELQARVVGSVAMIQAFLPLIRKARGRIVWIMTPALLPTPYVTSIHACDFARNCVARTLDIELKPWKIANIMIKCGGIKTPSGLRTTKDIDLLLRKSPENRAGLYRATLEKWAKEMTEFDHRRVEPAKVARVAVRALTAKRPRRRYSVGYLSRPAAFLEAMPQAFVDWMMRRRF